jgi:hypothetical protein
MVAFPPILLLLAVIFTGVVRCSDNALLMIGDSTTRYLFLDGVDILCPNHTNWKWMKNYSTPRLSGHGYSCGAKSPFRNVAHFHFFGVSPTEPYAPVKNIGLDYTTHGFPGHQVGNMCSTCAAAHAIQLFHGYFGSSTNIFVILKSMLWDIARLPWLPFPTPTVESFRYQYFHNATKFIRYVKGEFPNMHIAWQTGFPANHSSNTYRKNNVVIVPVGPYAIAINEVIRNYTQHPHHAVTLIDEDSVTHCSNVGSCHNRDSLHLGIKENHKVACYIIQTLLRSNATMCSPTSKRVPNKIK